MKNKIRLFCVALAAFGLPAFGFMHWNNSGIDQVETSVSADVASNEPILRNIRKGPSSNFYCTIGPSTLEDRHWNPPYLTNIPEKQAAYEGGMDALKEYLKENSKKSRAHQKMDELQPFRLLFTVTKKGTIENVRLEGTSGYIAIDNTMMFLITNAPGKWEAAENSKGEKMDQEMVVSFGLTGC